MATKDMEKLIAHAKGEGFVYQGSEIYDGLANTWDYGPMGVQLKNNIKNLWWKRLVQECPYNVGIDSAIFMNPRVWQASGHVGNFNDPLIDCNDHGGHTGDKTLLAGNAADRCDRLHSIVGGGGGIEEDRQHGAVTGIESVI